MNSNESFGTVSIEDWEELVSAPNWNTRVHAARYDNIPVGILVRFAKDKEWLVRLEVSGDSRMPEPELRLLASDVAVLVRSRVAYNVSLPADLIPVLAKDEKWDVRQAVALRDDVPVDVMKKLAGDDEKTVIYTVCENIRTPPEILEKFTNSDDLNILSRIAGNPSTPVDVLFDFYCKDWQHDGRTATVWAALAANISAPVELFEEFTRSDDLLTLLNLSRNPSIPERIQLCLVKKVKGQNHFRGIYMGLVENPSATIRVISEVMNQSANGYDSVKALRRLMEFPEHAGMPAEWVKALHMKTQEETISDG